MKSSYLVISIISGWSSELRKKKIHNSSLNVTQLINEPIRITPTTQFLGLGLYQLWQTSSVTWEKAVMRKNALFYNTMCRVSKYWQLAIKPRRHTSRWMVNFYKAHFYLNDGESVLQHCHIPIHIHTLLAHARTFGYARCQATNKFTHYSPMTHQQKLQGTNQETYEPCFRWTSECRYQSDYRPDVNGRKQLNAW